MSETDVLKKTYIALKKTQKKLEDLESSLKEPLAVIGMGCRLPGGADDPNKFWTFLESGGDASVPVPEDRWDADQYCDPAKDAPGKTHAYQANFLKVSVDEFDSQFFSISGREAQSLDPQQRLLLEITWEAMEDAGLDANTLSGSRTGVYIGISSDDYTQSHRHSGNNELIDGYSLTGTCFAPAAGRIAYTFGFEGPCIAVDTACSSSLVALHVACQGLRRKESDLAVVGGVNLILSPIFHICSTKLGTISPDGRCKTFDASADGYGRGEGCGILLLKRLSDAIADGDRIHALIRGTAVNQDGKSNGLTAPNGLAQQKVIRAALEDAGVTPADINYIEAHGTGTPLGDPIEVEALVKVLQEGRPAGNPVLLGSAKTNIGHLEAAAGVAGLLKVIQCLRHEQISPHLHFNNPSPYIAWDELPVQVTKQLTPWPRNDNRRRAGISSFGFSGTNAHAIVEEAPLATGSFVNGQSIGQEPDRPVQLLPLSAKNEDALKESARRYADYLDERTDSALGDICYTAGTGRSHFNHRIAVQGSSHHEVRDGLNAYLDGKRSRSLSMGTGTNRNPQVAFLFTGQGSQYVGMGRSLYKTQPVFRAAVETCDKLFSDRLDRSIIDLIYSDKADEDSLAQTQYTQPAIFTIQYALSCLWDSWGIKPDFVSGHSIGEYAGACIAGVLSLEDAVKLVAARGQLMQSLPAGGAMAAVFAGEADLLSFVESKSTELSIAALNAPGSAVISGKAETVAEVVGCLKKKGISARELNVSHAFHSPLMEPILESFRDVASKVTYMPAQLPLVSTVTGKKATAGDLASAEYWTRQIRQAVRFQAAAETLSEEGANVFLELGALPTLTGLAARTLSPDEHLFFPSLKKGEEDWNILLKSVGDLYVNNVDVDWRGFDEPYVRQKTDIPSYPFQRKRYYMPPIFDTRASGAGLALSKDTHPYLGQRITSPGLGDGTVLYQNVFTPDRPSFLAQHVIFGKIISPAAAHISMALSACQEILGKGTRQLEEVEFTQPLVLDTDEERIVQVVVDQVKGEAPTFHLVSRSTTDDTASWKTHCSGRFQRPRVEDENNFPDLPSTDTLESRCPREMQPRDFYSYIETVGYTTGPDFQCIRRIQEGQNESVCRISASRRIDDVAIHPGLIDSLLQTVLPACAESAGAMLGDDNVLIPLHMGTVSVQGALTGELICYNHVSVQEGLVKSEISVWNDEGEFVLRIKDFLLKQTHRNTLYKEIREDEDDLFHFIEWIEPDRKALAGSADEKVGESNATFTVFADSGGFGDSLCSWLAKRDVKCLRIDEGKEFQRIDDTRFMVSPRDTGQIRQILDEWNRQGSPGVNHIVFSWGLDSTVPEHESYLTDEQERLCGMVLDVVHTVDELRLGDRTRLWLVTSNTQAVIPEDRILNPTAGTLWGFGRAIALERPELWGGIIDLDGDDSETTIQALVKSITPSDREDQLAIRHGGRCFVARLVKPGKRDSEQRASSNRLPVPEVDETQSYYLSVGERHTLDDLRFEIHPRRAPRPHEVEIRVHAAGLNFRDVLNALGQYPGDAGPMGFESTGTVISVGENVSDLNVGDAVIAMGSPGCIGSFITLDRALVARKPPEMSFEEAVTIPATFLTAGYALNTLAQLREGERVLIHAGAGGVGMAAVQLAKNVGAEIFATAGSEWKRDLLRSLGVQHVMNSRTVDFADEIKRITNGQGVDVVLNSLSGEFIAKSFSALAENGRFLEMGKIGIWDESHVRSLYPTVSYYPFDLAAVAREDPKLIGRIFEELMVEFRNGNLKPLPTTVFPLEEAPDAFRYMAQAKHVGKIVLSREEEIRRAIFSKEGIVRSDRTYLVTGGMGALGLLVAEWLVDEGARHLVLLGRSDPKPQVLERIGAMKEVGVDVTIAKGDVSLREDVDRVFAEIRETIPPVAGIIHAAGVLDDGMIAEQTWDRFRTVMAPKVAGAWNLHAATERDSLDFLVFFSSVASINGNLGQSNYASANAFLDAMAHYRRKRGLPATSINWGPWAEVGMAADVEGDRFASQGMQEIQPDSALQVLKTTLEKDFVQPCVVQADWAAYAERHGLSLSTGLFSALVADTNISDSPSAQKTHNEGVIEKLRTEIPGKRRDVLLQFLQSVALDVLGYGESERIAPDEPLVSQGFDSLMSVDMRNRLGKELGQTLPASLLFDYPTLDRIADYVLADVIELDEPQDGVTQSPVPEPETSPESVLKEIDELLTSSS